MALFVVAALITGQDIYIFSIIGPAIDLRTGPEGIRDAQIFGNMRNAVTTIITHGLLIAIIVVLLTKPTNIYAITKPGTDIK